MALRVWLPLNGNINNYGISDLTFTNSNSSMITVNNSGKIGKCYSFNSTASNFGIQGADITSQYINNKSWSLCAWVKTTASDTCIMSLSYGLRLFAGNSIYITLYNSSRTVNCQATGKSTTDGLWHHIVAAYDHILNKIYIFVDGLLINTVNYTSGYTYASSWNNGTFIGKDPNNSTVSDHYLYKGLMNDVRIYDHCLSPKEVKEISKGLCLHYKLTGPGRPNLLSYQKIVKQNNVSFSYDPNTSTFTTKTPTTATYYGIRMSTNNCIIPWNHVGIMSMDILSPVATTFWRDDNDYAVSGNSWSGNDNTSRGSVVTAIPANKWTKVIIYSINNSSLNTNHESVKVQSSFNINTADVEFKFKNVKFEVSSISTDRNVTPWCPASDDTLYTASGYNNNIEDDCSGYGRNGTKNGMITWDSDTPRYATSYKFNSTSTKIKATAFGMSGFMNSYTFSWWQKNTGSGNMPWGFSDGNRLNLYHTTNLCWNTGDGGSNPFKDSSGTAIPNTRLCDSTWHHCVVTGNGSITKLYIDGIYVGYATTYKPITGTQIYISGWDTSTSYTFNGSNISDFRIYATALSDADILELYNTSMSIDNVGNMYTYEFEEIE